MKKLWIVMLMSLVAVAAHAESAKEPAKEDAKKGVAKPVSESAAKAVKTEEAAAETPATESAKPAEASRPAATSATTSATTSAAAPEGEIKVEAKLCKRIENREPADEGTSFSVTDGSVHAWTRVHGATGSKVHHVWFKGDTQVSDVELNVGGSPWRTYSRKTLGEESKGDWRVEIRDDGGSVLETLKFNVE